MHDGIVSTIGLKCKRCYSCIRECPANAIRVVDGQAVVIEERCISCGHCVKVCSQNAKMVKGDSHKVLNELLSGYECHAIIAPAFAASFPDTYNKLSTALKRIGFKAVSETAFGADLVSVEYSKYAEDNPGKTIISSPCPAIYNYIEKYFTELVPNLAPIVSPMIAMGRYLKNQNQSTKVVFIGPCIAKKHEYQDVQVTDAVDAVLTFSELRDILESNEIVLSELEETPLDPPYASMGKSYSIPGGLLKTAGMDSDILTKDTIIVDGKEKVKEVIKEIANGNIKSKFVDILFCEGCINGPAIDSDLNFYSRREKVIEYIDSNMNNVDKTVWKSELFNNRDLSLSREFTKQSKRRPMPSEIQIEEILAKTDKYTSNDELNCGACGYKSCRDYAIAIAKGLAEEDMCLPYLIDKLENAYSALKDTQEQLHNAEKLASIGQLAAGVAHELNNPLGTILLYSSMLRKEFEKSENCIQKVEDIELIIDESNRCKNIVSNLLNFARHGKLKINSIKISDLLNSIIQITNKITGTEEVITITDYTDNQEFEGDKDQIKQVFVNIINNALEAMEDKQDKQLHIEIVEEGKNLIVEFTDNGYGIPEENISKLFTPFFTTKKIGKGTGLGLAISYGIIKMHKGDIKINSEPDLGTTVTVRLPFNLTIQNAGLN